MAEKYAIVENETVVNIVESSAEFAVAQGWIDATGLAIGDIKTATGFIAPEKIIDNAALREAEKIQRDIITAKILVTTSTGNVFNGDEVSQNRLSRAILALQLTGTLTTHWVLANNVATEVGVPELAEALALSGAAQTALWVK